MALQLYCTLPGSSGQVLAGSNRLFYGACSQCASSALHEMRLGSGSGALMARRGRQPLDLVQTQVSGLLLAIIILQAMLLRNSIIAGDAGRIEGLVILPVHCHSPASCTRCGSARA